jgi:hypothetical protein
MSGMWAKSFGRLSACLLFKIDSNLKAFLAEDVNKPCERRNPSCRPHRSSGFALRLIANKILSSGDRSGNFPSLRCSASIYFLFIDETLPPACDEGNPTPDPLIRAYAQ